MFIKVIGFIGDNGHSDYKGLNIDNFVAGSQVYDFDNKVCIIETNEDYTGSNPDLQVLTKEEYIEIREIMAMNSPAGQEKSEVEKLKEEINQLNQQMTVQQAAINTLLGV